MRAAIVARPIDPAALLAEIADTSNGAAVLFTGSVRELSDGRSVSGIDYDAYEAMAAEELTRIVKAPEATAGTAMPATEAWRRTR